MCLWPSGLTPVSTVPFCLPASQFTVCTSRFTRPRTTVIANQYVAIFLVRPRSFGHCSTYSEIFEISREPLLIFSSNLPGNLALKMVGIFSEIFLVSVSHKTKHENSSQNSRKIRSKIRGKIRDENSKNSGTFVYGGSQMGVRVLRLLVLNCPQLPTIVIIWRRRSPPQKGPKGHKNAQLQTIVHEWPRVTLSPHLRALIRTVSFEFFKFFPCSLRNLA